MSLSDFLFQQQACLTELKQSNIDCNRQQKNFFTGGLKASAWIYVLSIPTMAGIAFMQGQEFMPMFLASTLVQLASVMIFGLTSKKLFSLSPGGNKAYKRHLMAQASFLPLLKEQSFQEEFVRHLDALARQFGNDYHNSYQYAGIVRNELDYFKKLLIQDNVFQTRSQEVLDKFESLCVLSEELEKRLHTVHKLERFSSVKQQTNTQVTGENMEKEVEQEKELELSASPDPMQKALLKML